MRQKDKADVRVTKSMCGADCWTDHRLIVSEMKFVLQIPKRPQGPKAPKKMDAAKLFTPAMKEILQTRLNGVLENHVIDPGNIDSSWQTFSEKSLHCFIGCHWHSLPSSPGLV